MSEAGQDFQKCVDYGEDSSADHATASLARSARDEELFSAKEDKLVSAKISCALTMRKEIDEDAQVVTRVYRLKTAPR